MVLGEQVHCQILELALGLFPQGFSQRARCSCQVQRGRYVAAGPRAHHAAHSVASAFEAARSGLPMTKREAAMRRYLAAPIDGAKPQAIAETLLRLADGDLLSPASTRAMLAILARTHSGPLRIKAGVPAGWTVYHKTGTGQILGSLATGFNDVALLRAPSGELYALAVMIAQTRVPIPERLALMQHVARAVVQNARRQP